MQYFLKQAGHFGGKDYQRGVNDLPEKAENDPFFLKCVGAGLITEVDAPKIVSTETLQDRQKKLLNRLIAKANADKEARAAKADELKAEEPSKEVDSDDGATEEIENDFLGKPEEQKKKPGRPKKQKEE